MITDISYNCNPLGTTPLTIKRHYKYEKIFTFGVRVISVIKKISKYHEKGRYYLVMVTGGVGGPYGDESSNIK